MIRDKIVAAEALDQAVRELPRPVVFTNGVFDILHRGHVTYLEQARALGASLVIGLNSDASVRELGKGEDRPIIGQQDRAFLLGALESVSLVTLFDEQTPLGLIERVRPDIYVKGGDYDVLSLAETELVQQWGGTAQSLPYVDGFSTTDFLARLRGE